MFNRLSRFICFILLFSCSSAFALEMAITFDDLPTHGPLPPHSSRLAIANQILTTLRKHHIQNVYGFINGKRLEEDNKNITVLENWVQQGHLLGSHTYTHLDLAAVSINSYLIDIAKNEVSLLKVMGSKDYNYFRYPYLAEGNTQEKRDQVRAYLAKKSYRIAPVTIDFSDFEWNTPYARCMKKYDIASIEWLKKTYIEQALNAITISHELSMLLFGRDIKNILLIHIGAFDALMLDDLLTAYEQQGVTFISLPEALKDEVYQINPNIISNRSYTFLNQIRLARGLSNPEIVDKLYQSLPEEELLELCQ